MKVFFLSYAGGLICMHIFFLFVENNDKSDEEQQEESLVENNTSEDVNSYNMDENDLGKLLLRLPRNKFLSNSTLSQVGFPTSMRYHNQLKENRCFKLSVWENIYSFYFQWNIDHALTH